MITTKLPSFIALCGNPTSGKSTVAEIITELYDAEIMDSGKPLREIAKSYLGLTHDQVYTQEGKASFVDVLGVSWQVRDILGTLGNKFEETFGEFAMPHMSSVNLDVTKGRTYIDASCRKTQAKYWKARGGIAIGIKSKGAYPSKFQFDKFDETLIDVWIVNDWRGEYASPEIARRALKNSIKALLDSVYGVKVNAN